MALTGIGVVVAVVGSGSSAAPAAGPSPLPGKSFVAVAPPATKGPDDLTRMAVEGLDGGTPLIWTAFQNGINPDGTPGTAGGPTQSTIAGFDPASGTLVETIPVTGKVDGLTADAPLRRLIATVNEDSNSAFNLVDPASKSVTLYTYSPSPAVAGNGGTDSIAVRDGLIYVAHSNPNDTTQATDYLVTLDDSTHTAVLSPVFFDDSAAKSVNTGATVALALIDPDTTLVLPEGSPRFAGDLTTISQADGEIIFASHLSGTPRLEVLSTTDNVPGNVPPLDGMAVATADSGTLYAVDAAVNEIEAFDTTGWPAGTVFVGEANDNGNPLIGTLDLKTGVVTPLANTFKNPKGLLFVPNGDDQGGDG